MLSMNAQINDTSHILAHHSLRDPKNATGAAI